jgi:hemoglobin
MTPSPAAAAAVVGPAALRDVANAADVEALVVAFYERAFADPLLGPVFVDVARMDLPAHLPAMRDFWMTVLFRAGTYRRNALEPHRALHAQVGLTDEHFARWLVLWRRTVAERHAGPVADRALVQAERIAGSLSRRLSGQDDGLLQVAPARARPDGE